MGGARGGVRKLHENLRFFPKAYLAIVCGSPTSIINLRRAKTGIILLRKWRNLHSPCYSRRFINLHLSLESQFLKKYFLEKSFLAIYRLMNLQEPQQEWRFRHFGNKIIRFFAASNWLLMSANHKLRLLFLIPVAIPTIRQPVFFT